MQRSINRRDFLASPAGEAARRKERKQRAFIRSEFANRALPTVPRSGAGIEPYAGPWGPSQVRHLLRRTTFGASPQQVTDLAAMSMAAAVDALLAATPLPDPPLNSNANDTGAPVGSTWIDAPTSDFNSSRHNSLRSWWIGLMLNQGASLREKMTLFWHNHFATESAVIKDARFTYRNNALLRARALGNFRTMTKEVTVDGAMLRFLNGNTNTAANPNENYGRELQELFTIGKGPEIGPGNYTNYTEQDVQQAARVLSGWRDNNSTFVSYFTSTRHAQGDKQFSAAYGGTVIAGQAGAAGANEVDALLTMIFNQPETARYICRKLYRWFVYYVIDAAAEANVIAPLADIFRNGGYEIGPVLDALFSSAHFYDPVNVGCVIKNPLDLAAGTAGTFSVAYPDATNLVAQYNHWKYLSTQATAMQQELLDPPGVAGWPAYNQTPLYHEMWINSDTLASRKEFTDILSGISGNNPNFPGYRQNSFSQVIDPVAFANLSSNPPDPNVLIDDWAAFLYPIALTSAQKEFLKDALLDGLPDYEWTIEWTDYVSNPGDAGKAAAITTKLRGLLSVMLAMPEYQLT
jgi:uncharacterized protein (DUF1800 family)